MQKVSAVSVRPSRSLDLLSQREVASLVAANPEVLELFRQCALAVLNTGSGQDDAAQLLADYTDFAVELVPQSRGIRLEVFNAPASAFVDGEMIAGIQEHLFSVLRDIVYTNRQLRDGAFDMASSAGVTDAVFRILRHGDIVRPDAAPNIAVCWGGHSISAEEYDYSKQVGYELGLREVDIVTGCGIGAMKGPMKGAAVGHAKQRYTQGRYIGISEPGIIASESPNPIVNELVIMPDIEKRLEAFVRLAHGIVVFPGGAGTLEEILYILSILLHPRNRQLSLPLIFTAPPCSESYFRGLDRFLRETLGDGVADYYRIVIGNPAQVAREIRRGQIATHQQRQQQQESYCFNWPLHIGQDLQVPFVPTHANMAALTLDKTLPPHQLAAQLRCAFSGIVAGNVKAFGIEQVATFGPYRLNGCEAVLTQLEQLLEQFVEQRRMKLSPGNYRPCYRIAA